ncbi:VP2 [Rotavirus L]|nr:VP2 [Rotavirus L]
MDYISTLQESLGKIKLFKQKDEFQKEYDNVVMVLDNVEDDDISKNLLSLIEQLLSIFEANSIITSVLRKKLEEYKKKEIKEIKVEEKKIEKITDDSEHIKKISDDISDEDKNLIGRLMSILGGQGSVPYIQDVLKIWHTLSKTLFIDVENDAYSIYVPERGSVNLKPVNIEFKTIDKFKVTTHVDKKPTIILSNRQGVADSLGPSEILYTSSFFDDMSLESIKDLELYFLDKSLKLKKELPNLPYMSDIEKEINPFNVNNSIVKSFGQATYYAMINDRTDRLFDARRNAAQFDNIIVDAQNRNIDFTLRLHPFDQQLLRIVERYAYNGQDLADMIRRYAMLGADGYVIAPKIRVDRDMQLIQDRKSQVLDRLCELSGLVYRTRITHSIRSMSKLWKTEVFRTSLEDEITKIYSSAEISMTTIDATTSALSSINIGSAKMALDVLLNMSFFRFELDLVGSQSSFGSAMSAAIMLVLLPTDPAHMDEDTFDNLCNLVYNELIAWPTDQENFVKRAGMTNAFQQYVNGGRINRDIQAYMRHVLLRRPWLPLQRTNDIRRNCDITVPDIDLRNINDPTYMALGRFINGIIEASKRNPNPGKSINANSFRKLIRNMRDICINNLMPIVRLHRYNVERMARLQDFLPYSADLFDVDQNLRDERIRIKMPIAGVLSLAMGITKAPDAFDWGNMLEFADEIRKMNFAEAIATEDVLTLAVLKNNINPAISKKEVLLDNIEPPTPTVASITRIPSAALSAILSDRVLVNLVRNTHSFRMIQDINNALHAAFDNCPTTQHGIAKGALLHPSPQEFHRSSQFVRRDNVIFQQPHNIQAFNLQDLMAGNYYQGLIGQVRNRNPIYINGPIRVKTSNANDINDVTMSYLTMNSPYNAFIDPSDLKHQRMLQPREVDLFIDENLSAPDDEFDNVLGRTSVFVRDAQRLVVPLNSNRHQYPYHEIMITDSVTKYLTFTVALPPDLQLFNGALVYEM